MACIKGHPSLHPGNRLAPSETANGITDNGIAYTQIGQ